MLKLLMILSCFISVPVAHLPDHLDFTDQYTSNTHDAQIFIDADPSPFSNYKRPQFKTFFYLPSQTFVYYKQYISAAIFSATLIDTYEPFILYSRSRAPPVV